MREVFRDLDHDFRILYSTTGGPSIPPEQLLSALLLQVFYGVRRERQLMEQLDHNLLYRWFVGLASDDAVWDATTLRRIASDCSKAISSITSGRCDCLTERSRHCCQTSISPSMAR